MSGRHVACRGLQDLTNIAGSSGVADVIDDLGRTIRFGMDNLVIVCGEGHDSQT
jgi:hypothetical protein